MTLDISFQPMRVLIDGHDSQGNLVLVDNQLAAVIVRLDGQTHDPEHKGLWGLVANSGVGRRMGGTDPGFHTLLTCGRPKQSASSRFCSHTVQRPAKPKPLRSHSMASNPWMVRRAVWK